MRWVSRFDRTPYCQLIYGDMIQKKFAVARKAVVIADQTGCHTKLSKVVAEMQMSFVSLCIPEQQNNDRTITWDATERTITHHLLPMVFSCIFLVVYQVVTCNKDIVFIRQFLLLLLMVSIRTSIRKFSPELHPSLPFVSSEMLLCIDGTILYIPHGTVNFNDHSQCLSTVD